LSWNNIKENGNANFLAKVDLDELNATIRKEVGL